MANGGISLADAIDRQIAAAEAVMVDPPQLQAGETKSIWGRLSGLFSPGKPLSYFDVLMKGEEGVQSGLNVSQIRRFIDVKTVADDVASLRIEDVALREFALSFRKLKYYKASLKKENAKRLIPVAQIDVLQRLIFLQAARHQHQAMKGQTIMATMTSAAPVVRAESVFRWNGKELEQFNEENAGEVLAFIDSIEAPVGAANAGAVNSGATELRALLRFLKARLGKGENERLAIRDILEPEWNNGDAPQEQPAKLREVIGLIARLPEFVERVPLQMRLQDLEQRGQITPSAGREYAYVFEVGSVREASHLASAPASMDPSALNVFTPEGSQYVTMEEDVAHRARVRALGNNMRALASGGILANVPNAGRILNNGRVANAPAVNSQAVSEISAITLPDREFYRNESVNGSAGGANARANAGASAGAQANGNNGEPKSKKARTEKEKTERRQEGGKRFKKSRKTKKSRKARKSKITRKSTRKNRK
jgi:hypothetical protein